MQLARAQAEASRGQRLVALRCRNCVKYGASVFGTDAHIRSSVGGRVFIDSGSEKALHDRHLCALLFLQNRPDLLTCDDVNFRHHDQALNDIFQLPDIAGPGVRLKLS